MMITNKVVHSPPMHFALCQIHVAALHQFPFNFSNNPKKSKSKLHLDLLSKHFTYFHSTLLFKQSKNNPNQSRTMIFCQSISTTFIQLVQPIVEIFSLRVFLLYLCICMHELLLRRFPLEQMIQQSSNMEHPTRSSIALSTEFHTRKSLKKLLSLRYSSQILGTPFSTSI